MKPNEAIRQLWISGFFEEERTLKDIEKKIWENWKTTPSNLIMTLKLKSIRVFLIEIKNGVWKQRRAADKHDEIDVHYFEPGKPRTSRQNFVKILNELKGEILICDPYLNKDTLEALGEIKHANVKFLTTNKPNNIKVSKQDLQDFKIENPDITIKGFGFDHLHDRYILCEDRLFLLGHGFSIRNKESFIIELPKKFVSDLMQSLNVTFDQRWKHQQNIVL